jgi:hypothetical protein
LPEVKGEINSQPSLSEPKDNLAVEPNNNTADFAPPIATITPTVTASPAINDSKVETIVREEATSFIAETRTMPAVPSKPTRRRIKSKRARSTWKEGEVRRIPVQIFDRFAQTLIALLSMLWLLTLFIFFSDPFAYFALQSATVARPQTPRQTAELPVQDVQWCLMGDFSSESRQESSAMSDNGEKGDTIAGDRIFTIIHPIAEPGTHLWQVAPCNDPQNLFPPEPTWVVTTLPDQPVSFIFDLTQTNSSRYIASSYVVAASDSADQFQLIGDFQNWNPNDPAAIMQPVRTGIYQQVRHISEPGRYNAYVITDPPEGETVVAAIDGYGRTTQPIPLSFRTLRSSDLVVVRLDTNMGRATVLYNMNPLLAQIAFNNGSLIAGTVVGVVALLITFWLLLRSLLLWRHRSWLDAGCPRCHKHELMRIERLSTDRFLHKLGLPAFRYQCRHCTWQGTRLSIGGLSSSPKSRLARAQQV